MVGVDPDVEVIVPIDTLDTYPTIPFTFKARNIFGIPITVSGTPVKWDGDSNILYWNSPRPGSVSAELGVGEEKYFLHDRMRRRINYPIANEDVNSIMLRVAYSASPGGVPVPRTINYDNTKFRFTFIDFDDGSYVLVDLDTFEVDLEGWAKVDEVGATVLDRSTVQHRNGTHSMRHSGIDNTDVAYLTKNFVIGAVSRAFIRVPVFFEVVDDEKVILELITDAGDVSKKRTVNYAMTGEPISTGSIITGTWLYLGTEIPVDGTYEVRLRATCESGAALEIFYDDIKVVTKA